MVSKFLSKYYPYSKALRLRKDILNFQQLPTETVFKAWERFKSCLRKCPDHRILLVHQILTFYHGTTMIDREKIMVAADGNIMRKTPQEAYDLIENMTQHHYQWDSEVQYDTTTDMTAHYSKTTFASSERVEVLGNDTEYTIQSVQRRPGHPNTFHYTYSDESDEDEPLEVDFLLEETDAFLALDSIPHGINNEIFDAEGDILFLEKLLNIDSTKDLPPQELNNDFEGDILFLENLLKDEPSEAKNSEIDSLIRGPSDTFLMGDKEIKFNPLKDIDDPVPIPRVSEKPLDSLDPISITFDMTITNPLFDFDSEFTLNSDNLSLIFTMRRVMSLKRRL
ncbi:reverse transcriptase domain-containing protein [Tanacetum coccineum]